MENADAIERVEINGIMQKEGGRNVIRRYLEMCGVFSDPFTSDPIQHAYDAGRRAAGLSLANMIQDNCPELYAKLLKERIEDHVN